MIASKAASQEEADEEPSESDDEDDDADNVVYIAANAAPTSPATYGDSAAENGLTMEIIFLAAAAVIFTGIYFCRKSKEE